MARNARHYRKGWLFCCRRSWEASTKPGWSRCLLVASLSYIFFLPSVVAVACSWAAKPTLKGPKDDGRGVAGCPRRGDDGRGGPVFSPAHLWRPGGDFPPHRAVGLGWFWNTHRVCEKLLALPHSNGTGILCSGKFSKPPQGGRRRADRGIKRGGPHSGPRTGSSRERQSWHRS